MSAARRAFATWRKTSGRSAPPTCGPSRNAIRRRDRGTGRGSPPATTASRSPKLASTSSDAIATYDYYATLAEQARRAPEHARAASGQRASRRRRTSNRPASSRSSCPWNFPFVTTAWKVAPALAAGCTIVLKPSEITPLVELELGAIALEVGLPGGRAEHRERHGRGSGQRSLRTPRHRQDFVSPAATRVGEQVMRTAAAQIKSVSLELGGKSPMIVFDDAPTSTRRSSGSSAASSTTAGRCARRPRACWSSRESRPSLIERAEARHRVTEDRRRLQRWRLMASLTSAAQLRTVLRYIDQGIAEGLTLLTGGKRAAGFDARVLRRADDLRRRARPAARSGAKKSSAPCSACARSLPKRKQSRSPTTATSAWRAGIITADPVRAERVANALDAGHIWINSLQVVFPETSWGGFKRSGIGRELGPVGTRCLSGGQARHATLA